MARSVHHIVITQRGVRYLFSDLVSAIEAFTVERWLDSNASFRFELVVFDPDGHIQFEETAYDWKGVRRLYADYTCFVDTQVI